jgi:hypothetical protein
MLEMTSVAGLAALTGIAPGAVAQTPSDAVGVQPEFASKAQGLPTAKQQNKVRIAFCTTYWAATNSHADWISTKLLDGYWWNGAHTESRVEIVSVYIHQIELSGLGVKICKAKNIPIFKTVGEALTLGGSELAVEGVVIVGEHGVFPSNMKGQWLLPRWLIYSQVMRVFERSKRSVPVFNDKHFSYDWNEAKWMFNKSRELNFPLTGGSGVPTYYRVPEIELDHNTPLKASIVVGSAPDEGALFHCVDTLQAFVEMRKGGETGVKAIQYIKGPDSWKWTERNPWAGNLLESLRKKLNLKPGYYSELPRMNVSVIEYNDGTKAAIYHVSIPEWHFVGEIEGKSEPTIISMVGFPGPFSQYHAFNGQPHWITEMMVTKKEPFNAERLLLSTGILSNLMDSSWENGVYSVIGRRVETPFLNMSYVPTRGAQFSTGERPPNRPYIRGFDK